MPQKRLSKEVVNKYIKNGLKGLSSKQKEQYKEQTEKVWFRQYAKKSKEQLIKIRGKVRKGIKQGKYDGSPLTTPSKEERRFVKPKIKKGDKKKPIKIIEKGNYRQSKEENIKIHRAIEKTQSPTNKAKYVRGSVKYPDATKYELRYGVNSKMSQNYRIKHNRSSGYDGRIVKQEK